jgi:peptide/nickel transport system substrate-binding protein
MATRMGGSSIPTPAVPRRRDRGVDDMTVQLNLPASDITLVPAHGGLSRPRSSTCDYIGTNPLEHGVGTGAYRIVRATRSAWAPFWRRTPITPTGATPISTRSSSSTSAGPRRVVRGRRSRRIRHDLRDRGRVHRPLRRRRLEPVGGRDGRHRSCSGPTRTTRPMTTSWFAGDRDGRRPAGLCRSGHQRSGHHGGKPPCLPDPPRIRRSFRISRSTRTRPIAMLQESGARRPRLRDRPRSTTTTAATRLTPYAAQLRDAGFNVERVVIPGSTFWNDWTTYPFSSTNWNHRELGVRSSTSPTARAWRGTRAASPTPSSTRFSTRPTASRTPMPAARSWRSCRRSCRKKA